jgi:hypothetical protein
MSAPPTGDGYFYLITREDSGAHEGSLGFGSCAEHSNFTPCP